MLDENASLAYLALFKCHLVSWSFIPTYFYPIIDRKMVEKRSQIMENLYSYSFALEPSMKQGPVDLFPFLSRSVERATFDAHHRVSSSAYSSSSSIAILQLAVTFRFLFR